MKKNVLLSPLFLYNLALITHDATMSVNPSIAHKLNCFQYLIIYVSFFYYICFDRLILINIE